MNGEISVSKDLANKLFKLTGVSILTWLNLQASYDAKVLEIEELQNQDEKEICQLIDFDYFKRFGFVPPGRYTLLQKWRSLESFFKFQTFLI